MISYYGIYCIKHSGPFLDNMIRCQGQKCFDPGIMMVIVSVFAGTNYLVYSSILDKEQAEVQNTPYLHWIMMGAQGNGTYNGDDYKFTRLFNDRDEQQKALLSEIKKRYKTLGLHGTSQLWKNKTVKCFGDGTYALSDFFDDGFSGNKTLSDWVLYSGKHFNKYQTFCLGVFLAIMLLMLFGVIGSLSGKPCIKTEMTALWLAFLGVWSFLMLWETSARYFTNHLSVLILAALFGLPHFEKWVVSAVDAIKASWQQERKK